MKTLWCAVLIVISGLAAWAQEIKVPSSWDRLAAKADEVVKVTMDKKMLQFASKFMDNEGDAEGKRLVSKLNGIYVRSLEFKQPDEFTDADVEPIRAQLQGPEWSRIVQVESKPDKEHVEIYIRTVNNQTMGIVVLSQEPKELVLVHLDGPINPEDLDDLSGNFGIPKNIHVPKKSAPASTPPAVKK
ncbi:MAG: DUF4252 domain-containing protein [Terriglobia bacterium]|jgi:hypothetical protein|nr:DUF4252 domain-containing protein [Terriglobia bacterium]